MSFRDGPLQDFRVPLAWMAAIAVVVAAVIGVALLVSDRRETVQAQAGDLTKSMADTVAKPVGGALSAPVRWAEDAVSGIGDYFFAVSENRKLKREIADLEQWRTRALSLANDNGRFRSLLGLNTDPPIPMATGLVIADSRGPFANSRLANAGREKGILIGNPVMSEHGLVGRVVGVADGVSRILLLTDVSSRTPVMVDRTNARAILTGDGGPSPILAYMRGQDPVKVGDRVITSGDGGLFPRGLPVGTAVQGVSGDWRVALYSDDAPIDYVRFLLFRDFSQLANQKALSESTVPPLPPAEAADVAARAAPQPTVTPPTPLTAQPHAAAKPTTAAKRPAAPKPPTPAKPSPTPTTTVHKAPAHTPVARQTGPTSSASPNAAPMPAAPSQAPAP